MRRLIVLHYTGPQAGNLVIARRIARKIRGAVKSRQCILVDFEDTSPSLAVLELVAAEMRPDKVRVCGLSIADQILLKHLVRHRKGGDSA
jgi:hypothetical protein